MTKAQSNQAREDYKQALKNKIEKYIIVGILASAIIYYGIQYLVYLVR